MMKRIVWVALLLCPGLSPSCAEPSPYVPHAEMESLELPGYEKGRIYAVPLVPPVERGEDAKRAGNLLEPTTLPVEAGRVRLRLGADPVLLADPEVFSKALTPDPAGPFCLASAGPDPFTSYSDVAEEIRDLGLAMIRSCGRSTAHYGVWTRSGMAGLDFTDAAVRASEKLGLPLLILLDADPNMPGPPDGRPRQVPMPDLAQWRRFVREVVKRYNGDGVDDMPGLTKPVHGYVVHNEIDHKQFWTDTGKNYGRLLAEAAKIVRSESPSARIVMAGSAGSLASYLRAGERLPDGAPDPWMLRARSGIDEDGAVLAAAREAGRLLKGTGVTVDAVNFHSYDTAEKWRDFGAYARLLRRMASEVGWTDAEIWCTETATWGPSLSGAGPPDRTSQTEREQAQGLVKRYVYGRAVGISRIFWFGIARKSGRAHLDSPLERVRLKDEKSCRLAYYALRNLTHSLGGCDWNRTRLLSDGKDNLFLVQFVRDGRPMWVAWREDQ